MRKCEPFILNRGLYLGDYGFEVDKHNLVVSHDNNFVIYHYSREESIEKIFDNDGGLYAFRPVTSPKNLTDLENKYLTEGFLSPLPGWLTSNKYYKNLGFYMLQQFIGHVLLKIEIPQDFPGVYIADFAHVLECKKHLMNIKIPGLMLDYDCTSGKEVTQAYVNSYILANAYMNKHIAPIVQITRSGPGVVIPNKYISIAKIQPLAKNNFR